MGRMAPNEASPLTTHRVRDRQDAVAVEVPAGSASDPSGAGDRGQQHTDRWSLPVASRDRHARATLEMHPPSPSIGEDGAGSAEPAPETRFNHGTVTVQVTVAGSTTLPRSSDASVTLQLNSPCVAAGAPWQVWKVRVTSGDGRPPSLRAFAVKP